MEHRGCVMMFKYFVEFGEEGEIKALYKSKYECKNPCKEYIVNLIPIDRMKENMKKEFDEAVDSMKQTAGKTKKLSREIDKITRDLRRIKI